MRPVRVGFDVPPEDINERASRGGGWGGGANRRLNLGKRPGTGGLGRQNGADEIPGTVCAVHRRVGELNPERPLEP